MFLNQLVLIAIVLSMATVLYALLTPNTMQLIPIEVQEHLDAEADFHSNNGN